MLREYKHLREITELTRGCKISPIEAIKVPPLIREEEKPAAICCCDLRITAVPEPNASLLIWML